VGINHRVLLFPLSSASFQSEFRNTCNILIFIIGKIPHHDKRSFFICRNLPSN